MELGKCTVTSFPDGETFVKIDENIRGEDCFVVQSTCPPSNHNLMELFIWIDCLRRALATQANQLEALSHARVLERGYAIVRGRVSGHVITRLSAVGAETELGIVFADGELPVRRAEKSRGSEPRRGAEQGRLL